MMLISALSEIDDLLEGCRAVATSKPTAGEGFYEVKRQQFRFPDGIIQPREYIDKKHASVVAPVTSEGNFVFVIQPVSLSREGSLIEFPAGYWEIREDGVEAGKRELAEETGYTTSKTLIHTGFHYQDPGSIRQTVDTYVAIDCQKTQSQKLDRGEYVKYIEVPLDIVDQMISHNYFKDANTFIALFKALRILDHHAV